MATKRVYGQGKHKVAGSPGLKVLETEDIDVRHAFQLGMVLNLCVYMIYFSLELRRCSRIALSTSSWQSETH